MGRRLCDFGLAIYTAKAVSDSPDPPPGAKPSVDLEPGGWIGWADGRKIEARIPDALAALSVKHQADSFLVMRAMVAAGLGLAVLPCYWADRDPRLQRAYPDIVSHPDLGLWLLYHPDRKQEPRLRAFVDFIIAEVLQRRTQFEGTKPGAQGLF